VSPGAALYAETTCIDCHGRGGAGGSLGPPLENLSAHWDSATLAAYLEDPRPFLRQDERLARLGQRYIMSMPSFRRLDPTERKTLAEHLLATHP
jgi:mono/diheme cytochrome c family protein